MITLHNHFWYGTMQPHLMESHLAYRLASLLDHYGESLKGALVGIALCSRAIYVIVFQEEVPMENSWGENYASISPDYKKIVAALIILPQLHFISFTRQFVDPLQNS